MTFFPVTGFVDPGGSSTVALAGGETFTGVSEDVGQFSTVTVMLDTNVNGTLRMEFSTDNSNWDVIRPIPIDVSVRTYSTHVFAVVGKFYRTVYVNGPDPQTHLRLQTMVHHVKSIGFPTSPNTQLGQGDDCQLMRVANWPQLDMSRNMLSDKSPVMQQGHNPSVGGSFEDVWTPGGDYPWPIAAETIRIATGGDADDDDAGGIGARTITVEGLDTNFDYITENITCNGASASSATTGLFRRINKAFVATCGTYSGKNADNITIENTVSGNTIAVITAGRTEMTMYTVRTGYSVYLLHLHSSIDTKQAAEICVFARENADVVTAPFSPKTLVGRAVNLTGSDHRPFEVFRLLPAKTDIWVEARASAGTSAIVSAFDMVLIKD